MASGPRVDAVGVVVTDMARAIRFYRRLGCTFPDGAESEGHAEAELGGGVRLMLDTAEMLDKLGFGVSGEGHGHGMMALAVRCDSPAQVDELYAEFAAEGLGRTEPFDAPWGQRYAMLSDPDGSHVDLYAAAEPA